MELTHNGRTVTVADELIRLAAGQANVAFIQEVSEALVGEGIQMSPDQLYGCYIEFTPKTDDEAIARRLIIRYGLDGLDAMFHELDDEHWEEYLLPDDAFSSQVDFLDAFISDNIVERAVKRVIYLTGGLR